MIKTRNELHLKSQEVIINEFRVKRARKKVVHDLNSQFIWIQDIKEVLNQQETQKTAWNTKDRTAEARKTVQAIQNKDMMAFMSKFSVVDMSCVVNRQ